MSDPGSYGVSMVQDLPLNVTSPDICLSPGQYSVLQNAVFQNTVFFGKICLIIGFALGLTVMYFYLQNKQKKTERDEYDRFVAVENERCGRGNV
jgi:hypothetical protein